jgi:ATP-dependent DNA ligase
MEGVMAKRADSPYVGSRSRDWLKFKAPGYHEGWERPNRK